MMTSPKRAGIAFALIPQTTPALVLSLKHAAIFATLKRATMDEPCPFTQNADDADFSTSPGDVRLCKDVVPDSAFKSSRFTGVTFEGLELGSHAFSGTPCLCLFFACFCKKIGGNAFTYSSICYAWLPVLETIGQGAFSYSGLKSIFAPHIQIIPFRCFVQCIFLKSVEFESVKEIDISAFYGCESLEIAVFVSVKHVRENAFGSCSNLETIVIPMCTHVEYEAFNHCRRLKVVEGGNIQAIAARGFYQCRNLSEIDLSNCKTIRSGAFHDTDALVRVDFGSIELIDDAAFCRSGLKCVMVNNPKCVIHDRAFLESQVESVDVVAEHIGDSIFRKCIHLKTVNIRVDTLGYGTFEDCRSLLTAKTTATVIGKGCFCECTSLYKCFIPNAKIIRAIAFWGCTSLESITQVLPTQELGYQAFYGCYQMYNAPKMPALTKIGVEAFLDSGVKNLLIPKTVTDIGKSAWEDCRNLHTVTTGSWEQDSGNQKSFDLSWMNHEDHPNLFEMSVLTTANHPPIDCVVKHDTVENLKQMLALKYVSTRSRLAGERHKCIVSFIASLIRLREPMQCSLPDEMVMMILGMIAEYEISTLYTPSFA